MITADFCEVRLVEGEHIVFAGRRRDCEGWVERRDKPGRYSLHDAPFCACCGIYATVVRPARVVRVVPHRNRQWRCEKHADRNPCAIEGCERTTPARGFFGTEQWLCGEHWRMACPPKSAQRRVYNRLFALEKKHGWTPDLDARYWRIWPNILRHARGLTAGDIDMKEINAMFGWTE